MSMNKYLFVYRTPVDADARQPSPEEMQAMFQQWNAWKERFKANILDLGDGLLPTGKVLKAGVVTDGPFIEAKEVVGGFSIVSTETYEQALDVARACPMTFAPGYSIEIRQMAGF